MIKRILGSRTPIKFKLLCLREEDPLLRRKMMYQVLKEQEKLLVPLVSVHQHHRLSVPDVLLARTLLPVAQGVLSKLLLLLLLLILV